MVGFNIDGQGDSLMYYRIVLGRGAPLLIMYLLLVKIGVGPSSAQVHRIYIGLTQ